MSLDSKQKRGSAISVALPWRAWVSDPNGSIEFGDRLSFLRFASANGGVEYGGALLCGSISVSPALTGTLNVSQLLTGVSSVLPALSGDIELDCECC